MPRSDDYRRGFREAGRLAVSHLHELTDEIGGPHAKRVRDCAAFGMGTMFRNRLSVDRGHDRDQRPRVSRRGELPERPE